MAGNMRLRAGIACLSLGLGLAAGCGLLLDFNNLDTGGSGGTSGSGGGSPSSTTSTGGGTSSSTTSGTTTTSSMSTVSSTTGSTTTSSSSSSTGMVPPVLPPVALTVVGPDGGPDPILIDATEVTVAQYAAFVESFNAAPQTQRDVCTWNRAVEPNTAPANDAGVAPSAECDGYDLSAEAATSPNAPIRCIHWCDAAAYCTWAGGWMCHGNEGKPYAPEWKTACESAAGLTYPYGNTYVAGRCVDAPGATQPLDVHSRPMCEGGFTGLFDMSGNVGEWLDCGCEYDTPIPTNNSAYVGGGGYLESGSALACAPTRTLPLIGFYQDVGARCCYPGQ